MNASATAMTENNAITTDDLDAISDIYVWDCDDATEALDGAWVNFGSAKAVPIAGQPIADWVHMLLRDIQQKHSAKMGDNDFMIETDGHRFRGNRAPTVGHPLLSLRHGTMEVPRLEDLLLPRWWSEILLQSNYAKKGGLILMAAETGCGKSTTIAAMIASRLTRYGGHCRTIEDPCEFPLHGPWGSGRCIQREVDPTIPVDQAFAKPMRDFLRAYPASTDGGRIMFVGEVRDSAAAAELVRNACNGMLVISTIHADNEATAVKRLCALAQSEIGGFELACDMVASSLRCVLSQHLVPNAKTSAKGWHRYVVHGDMLLSNGPQHPVGSTIAEGKFKLLAQAQDRQRTLLKQRDPRQITVDDLITEGASGG